MIKNLKTQELSAFIGKNTDDNSVNLGPEWLLAAKNVILQGDGKVKTCPGYTLVRNIGAGKMLRFFDFQRDADGKQFIIVNHGTNLGWIPADGSAAEAVLSATESATDSFDLIAGYYAAYGNNGKNAYRIVDVAGTLTKFKWGIDAPLTAPTLSFSAGTLTLKYGRRYCVADVAYYTDSKGVQRMHIGPPSPISAHTGPQTSSAPTLGLEISADPQVTHKWIFETVDTPLDTSSTYYFAAEITNATASWADTLTDDLLDTTRLAPFDNHPAPLGTVVLKFQNRAVIIDPVTGFIYASGFEEIDLGDPLSSFPSDLFFTIPSGTLKPTGGRVVDDGQTLLIGTEEAWFKITGYNASTFQMKDRVIGPGPVGKDAITVTPTHVLWVSRDKRIRAWDTRISAYTGIPANPLNFSKKIEQKLAGTYSIEDLKDSELANVKLQFFSYGKLHFVICAGNTNDENSTALNWFQLWYITYDETGAIASIGESDFIPSDLLSAVAPVLVGSTPYLFLGNAANGDIYRWPDSFLHNGQKFDANVHPAWFKGPEATKRLYWMDIITDRTDAAKVFSAFAAAAGAPNMNKPLVPLQIMEVPGVDADPLAFRAMLQGTDAGYGRYMRPVISFPSDGKQSTLNKILISYAPVFNTAP